MVQVLSCRFCNSNSLLHVYSKKLNYYFTVKTGRHACFASTGLDCKQTLKGNGQLAEGIYYDLIVFRNK